MSWSIRKVLTGINSLKVLWNRNYSNNYSRCLCLRWPAKYGAKQNHILSIRSFQLGSAYCAKTFVELENDHAHSYLENNSMYSPTLVKEMDLMTDVDSDSLNVVFSQDWDCRATNEVFEAFRCASVLGQRLTLDVNDPKLEKLSSAVLNNLDKFEGSQLLGILQCLSLWPRPEAKSGRYFTLWKALDKVCLRRVKTWDIDMNLLMVDHWARLNLARLSESVKSSLMRISRKLERLSPRQFVQLMFYINLCRKLPPSSSKFEFEYTLETLTNKLTFEELSIVSMGFFKSQTHVRNQQISERILTRLESSFRNGDPPPPDSIMLASILKVLRTCVQPKQYMKTYHTLDAMLPHLKNYSLLCCLHVALIGSNIQLIHEGVMDSLCERFLAEMENCRLKDIERMAFILTLHNYNSKTNPCIYDAMVSEIRKRVEERERDDTKWIEIHRHGECLVRFLGYLTFKQICPLDLIEKTMDPDFIKMAYGNHWGKIGREVLTLHASLEILFPGQIKNMLDSELRNMLIKKYQQDLSRYAEGKTFTAADRLHVDVLKSMNSLSGGEDRVSLKFILPQFERPDIVFCIGKNKIFQNLSLDKCNPEALKKCPSGFGNWCALITGGRNSFIKPSNQPAGPLVNKMLLLKKLGYIPILVPFFEWEAATNDEKERYLIQKIFNSLQDDSEF